MRNWLKKAREDHGMSTYSVAKEAGISQTYYSAIELGMRGAKMPVQTAKKIAEVLGFDWTMLYEDGEEVG